MAEIAVMGAGGEYMESVVVVQWHKQLGDDVKQGDLLVTVETAKAATEIEAQDEGILTEIRVQIGEEVPLGTVLGIIGDSLTSGKSELATAEKVATVEEDATPSVTGFVSVPDRVMASPLARRIAQQQQMDLTKIIPSSPSGRIKLRDLKQTSNEERQSSLFVHCVENGGKEKIVFLHGFGSDSSSWNPLITALGSQFDCYLVDLPGHGRSPLPKAGLDVRQIAGEVATSLILKGLDEFHLVGHSLGGAVCLSLLEQFLKSVKRFSDKNCGKNKELEQLGEPSETKTFCSFLNFTDTGRAWGRN